MTNQNYAFIGDVHSQIKPLRAALDHCQANGMIPILLGDLFDSVLEESHSAEVYFAVKEAMETQGAIVLRSNHQNKLERYIAGNKVRLCYGINRTLEDFRVAGISLEELGAWLNTFPYGVCFRDSQGTEYRAAHAMFSRRIDIPDYSGMHLVMDSDIPEKSVRDTMIYGGFRKTEQEPGEGNRLFWWVPRKGQQSDRNWVRVAGHYHAIYVDDMSIVLDGGIGDPDFGDEKPNSLCLWNVEEKSMRCFLSDGSS